MLPKTAEVLIGFTPHGVDNLPPLDGLLTLITRMVVVFGNSFEMPTAARDAQPHRPPAAGACWGGGAA
ncbi:hypothetical protein M878_00760 [Streptomyces roseochromogenus subsp. oscitans DS 12.976]|uniref:Uncharacterized protein n=1 Tax=Streptomyces roseochromogenus subsp. oscitans DS 12.976 TaxID=1352936 RepID=V6KXD7_STRRC|nr:hypothetical protein M878_00760 [Streptomyces roseochromogenus subsp. oscitans DS 12.976]